MNRQEQIKAAIQRNAAPYLLIYTNHPEALKVGEILSRQQAEQHKSSGICVLGYPEDKPVLLSAKDFKIKYLYHDTEKTDTGGDHAEN